jgi:hypothetical protein
MLFKGTVELEVAGVKRGFKFGMLASGYFCEEEKITLKEMTDRLQNPTPITAINCLYSAAKAYCVSKEVEITFKAHDVADWIDELGLDTVFDMIFKSMQVYQRADEKNVKTPELTEIPGEVSTGQ